METQMKTQMETQMETATAAARAMATAAAATHENKFVALSREQFDIELKRRDAARALARSMRVVADREAELSKQTAQNATCTCDDMLLAQAQIIRRTMEDRRDAIEAMRQAQIDLDSFLPAHHGAQYTPCLFCIEPDEKHGRSRVGRCQDAVHTQRNTSTIFANNVFFE
jgi:phosphopantetheine adenylyltransferase